MKKFLAIYTGSPEGMSKWQALEEKTKKEREQKGMKEWQNWATEHSKSTVEQGGPLGKTKRVTREGVSDIRNSMAAYTVIEAESHEAAAKIFLNHPHFTTFPGDGVEIMECLPLPKM